MQITKSKFPWLLGFSALFIAMCAAFFSVFGISTLFAGAFISTVIMASSLELGKLVGVTFLYRYWKKCNTLLKTYLCVASLVLMAITSLGIFGYLSAAYQKSSIEFGVAQEKIKATEEQKKFYQDKVDASKQRIEFLTKLRGSQEDRLSQILTNEVIARNPIQLRQIQQQNTDLIASTDKDIHDENTKIQSSIDEIGKISDQVNNLKLGTANKKDVQIFKFVADALNVPLDKVARWFILMIICVFDPLAICLILAYNVAVYKEVDEDVFDTPPIEQKVVEPVKPIEPEPVKEVEKVVEPVVSLPNPPQAKVEPEPVVHEDWYKRMFKL